jgi:RimJ/RimL family protein N-acetyltransferase
LIAAPLETKRLVLTPLAVADAEEMLGVLSDAALHEFAGGEPPSYDELVARYESQVAGSPGDDEVWLNWVIRLAEGGTAVGFAQANVTVDGADLAWVVATDRQGRGLAIEAARATKVWLVSSEVGLFSAHIRPDHAASQRVAAAIGLRGTGRLDDEGEEVWESGPP